MYRESTERSQSHGFSHLSTCHPHRIPCYHLSTLYSLLSALYSPFNPPFTDHTHAHVRHSLRAHRRNRLTSDPASYCALRRLSTPSTSMSSASATAAATAEAASSDHFALPQAQGREVLTAERARALLPPQGAAQFTRLTLSGHSFTQSAAEVFAPAIASFAGLTDVDLSDILAKRGTEEAIAVLDALCTAVSGHALRSLNLSDNAIGARGGGVRLRCPPLPALPPPRAVQQRRTAGTVGGGAGEGAAAAVQEGRGRGRRPPPDGPPSRGVLPQPAGR